MVCVQQDRASPGARTDRTSYQEDRSRGTSPKPRRVWEEGGRLEDRDGVQGQDVYAVINCVALLCDSIKNATYIKQIP